MTHEHGVLGVLRGLILLGYASSYDRHIAPRLGDVPLREFDAELVAPSRAT